MIFLSYVDCIAASPDIKTSGNEWRGQQEEACARIIRPTDHATVSYLHGSVSGSSKFFKYCSSAAVTAIAYLVIYLPLRIEWNPELTDRLNRRNYS